MAATLRVLYGSVCVDHRMNENLELLPVQMCVRPDALMSWARRVITFMSIFIAIVCRWLVRDLTDHKSSLGQVNGLVLSGNEPLPEPMLTKVHDAVSLHPNHLLKKHCVT